MVILKSLMLILFCLVQSSMAQKATISRLVGSYCKSETFSGICLTLKPDFSYSYNEGTDIQTFISEGTWTTNKDTLILNSFIQKEDLPISITEIKSKSSDSLTVFPIVTNLSDDVMHGATIYVNNDTSRSCMPAFENDCKFLKGQIYSILIELDGHVRSKWKKVNPLNSDTIKIVVNIPGYLGNAIFFENEKFLFNSRQVIPLTLITSTNSKPIYKREPYHLQKK